jgi:hypothetical protein
VYCARCGARLKEKALACGQGVQLALKSYCNGCFEALLQETPTLQRQHLLSEVVNTPPVGEPIVEAVEVEEEVPLERLRPKPKAPSIFGIAVRLLWIPAVGACLLLMLWLGYLIGDRASLQGKAAGTELKLPAQSPKTDARLDPPEFAMNYRRANPDDVEGIAILYRQVVEHATDEEIHRFFSAELRAVEEKLFARFDEQLKQIDDALAPLLEESRYAIALGLLKCNLSSHRHPRWAGEIQLRSRSIEKQAESEGSGILSRIGDSVAAGRREEAEELMETILAMGFEPLIARGRKLLDPSGVETAKKADTPPGPGSEPVPIPTPPPPEPPKGVEGPGPEQRRAAYLEDWGRAVDLARQRDYESALALLSRHRDQATLPSVLEDVKIFSAAWGLLLRAHKAIGDASRQDPLAVKYVDDRNLIRTAKGTLGAVADDSFSIKEAGKAEFTAIPFRRVAADTILEFGKASQDPFATAGFLLLEGDVQGARTLADKVAGKIPDRYWALKEVEPRRADETEEKGPKANPAEEEARVLLEQADRDFLVGQWETAVPRYQELAAKFRSTKTFKDHRKHILDRADTGKDSIFLAGGMTCSGLFVTEAVPGAPVKNSCTLKMRGKYARFSPYVEVSFFARAGERYRIWILTGGDCKSSMTIGLQYPEASVQGQPAEVGTQNFVTLFPESEKDHSPCAHSPARWSWIQVGATWKSSGMKKLRVYGYQGGLSIGSIVISSNKYKDSPPDPRLLK